MKSESATSFIVHADFNFAMIPQWVIMRGFSASAISVYTVLAMYRNNQTSDCFPSKSTLCDKTGLTPNTVGKALKELECHGAVKIEKRFFGRSQTSNLYTLFMTGPHGIPQGFKPINDVEGGSIDAPPHAMVGGEGVPTIGGGTKPEEQTKGTRNNSSATLVADVLFAEFWKAYPKRKDKQDAIVAWNRALKKTSAERLIEEAKRYAILRKGKDPQFTKHPATWLNKGSWMDEEEEMFESPEQAKARVLREALERTGRKELGA